MSETVLRPEKDYHCPFFQRKCIEGACRVWDTTNLECSLRRRVMDLEDLDNVEASPSSNDLLQYDGSNWVNKSFSDLKLCRIATGVYSGDGSRSQAITGIGFQPKYVIIVPHQTTTHVNYKNDQMGGNAVYEYVSGATCMVYEADHIDSLDSDGFTVDDIALDLDPNTNGRTYSYVAIG